MSVNEQKLYNLCLHVLHGKLQITELALQIKKSYRQTQRIVKKVEAQGMIGVKHGNTGKRPHNATPDHLIQEITTLFKEGYYDFNMTHFREMLHEKEGISIGKNIIHKIAVKNNLVKRPKRRAKGRVHNPRPRLSNEGALVQFDGSEHNWFGDIVCDLIGGIDDATGTVVGLEFFHGETSLNCMKVMKDITEVYGLPNAYYLDGAGYFGKKDKDVETQIGRALEQLGVKVYIASSAQAKGRIERLWGTMQDRLIAELRYYQISTIAEANNFLKEQFVPEYNKKFAVAPRESTSFFRKILHSKLDNIFCKKNRRKISNGNTFSYEGEQYILQTKENYKFRTININHHIDGSTSFDICNLSVHVKSLADIAA